MTATARTDGSERRPRARLATRLMAAQVLVIAVGAVTLVVTALLVAPSLFHEHLARTGEDSPEVQLHAEEAFVSSFAIAIAVGTLVALIGAGLVSWLLVRRVSQPVEELADAAESVAAGNYAVDVPDAAFSSELHRLSDSFAHMAGRLAETERTRAGLLSDLAHELRTPLATLEAYVDGLEDGVVPADDAAYATMRGEVDRLRRLADDLRQTAYAEEGALRLHPVSADLADVVRDCLAAAQPRYAAAGVPLRLAVSPAPRVRIDVQRIQQAVGNLLDNALRHSGPGEEVLAEVGTAGDGSARVTVTDRGDGIPVDQLDAVFQRFHRVDAARTHADGSGTGLGLTIARAIVVDHGGSLVASSDGPGTGATFTLTLPGSPARAASGPDR
ncbi:MAG: HAMP domain-containing sensor histidine kinase [Candidatus Nanopelagicales bacterium]